MSYVGKAKNWSVTHDGRPLPTCTDKVNHSPDGFSWGYPGSGPAQLAYAILHHFTKGNEDLTARHYQSFKADVISRLPMDQDFEISDDEVRRFLDHERRRAHMAWGPGDVEHH